MDHEMLDQKKRSSDQCSLEWNLQFVADKREEDPPSEATCQLCHMDYLTKHTHTQKKENMNKKRRSIRSWTELQDVLKKNQALAKH